VRFTIEASGRVATVNIEESTLPAEVDRCISDAVETWEFPRPRGGGTVAVSYPFVLKSAGP
jgi:TonB family protein